MNSPKLTATAFMATLSTAGRLPVETRKPEQPKILMVDRWTGSEWVTVRMRWNGEVYVLDAGCGECK